MKKVNFIRRWLLHRKQAKGKIKLCSIYCCFEEIKDDRRYCDRCREQYKLKCSICENDASHMMNNINYCEEHKYHSDFYRKNKKKFED